MNTNIEPVNRLSKDLVAASITLSPNEARFLVDAYYMMQDDRKRAHNQIRALAESGEPHDVLFWLATQSSTLEKQIVRALDEYSASKPVGEWARTIHGIGPIIAAGLMAHIDITRAPTAGHIWRYAGLDPTSKWDKGQKRPWNAALKTLCVMPGMMVTTGRGHVPIEQVDVGDMVMTHRGRWRRVTKVMVNDHDGPVYGLRGAGCGNQVAWLTGGHPVFAAGRETYHYGRTFTVKAGSEKPFNWHAVETIRPRWLLSRPILQERVAAVPEIVLEGVAVSGGHVAAAGRWAGVAHQLANPVPQRIAMTPDLMRLIGLYVAEGHVSRGYIGWSFHENEAALIEFVKSMASDTFGVSATTSHNPENHCTQVLIGCKPLAEWFKVTIGKGSTSMAFPMKWLSLNDDLLRPLFDGIMAGDGDHVGKSAGRRISTASPTLARQIVDLARRLGMSAGVHSEPKLRACRIHINQRPDLEVSARNTAVQYYFGPVFNMEVDEDHSYIVEGYAVHNCWKIGESFVKVKGMDDAYYGKVYAERRSYEQNRSDSGELAEQAAAVLKRTPSHAQKATYADGKLPDGHLHARAKRYAVKLFLSHYHEQAYRAHYGEEPPLPYPIAHLGHAHKIPAPH